MNTSAPLKIAFLFPGQGSQAVGMGRELASLYPVARQTFDEADAALGYKLSEICFEGPEDRLRLTEVTQPAILTVSVAVYRVLREKGIQPDAVAGHSLGEYSAHVAAGTLTFEDAVRTVRNRGRYMQQAVPVGEGAMAAILGMAMPDIEHVCADAAQGEVVQPANINSPEQVVISGSKAAIERAAELAKQRGAKRAVLLPVSAPFHCALMQPAQDLLASYLAALNLITLQYPLVTNVDAMLIAEPGQARDALVRQVTGSVRWLDSIRLLTDRGVQTFIEVGPGRVLSGLMRQIDRSRTALNVEDESSLRKTGNHLLESKAEPA
jgi:[acyl-carrier-protein] S-malonyltransferase